MEKTSRFDWDTWLQTLGKLDEEVRLASLSSTDHSYAETAVLRLNSLRLFLQGI